MPPMFLAGALAPLLASATPADAVREQARRILERGEYQTELPAAVRLPSFELPLGPLGVLLRVLFWTALAVMAALAVAWLVRRLRGFQPDARAPAEPSAGAGEVGRRQLGAAEALAARGRFGEAIHVLLLDTLEALSRAARLAPSLTSREIVARVPLPEPARDALSGLVSAVEVSWFGGEDPGEAEYRLCVDRFHAFLDATRSAA
ncbi:MAG TPA: DUF4129 domain-containing protein [Anaeromyxobacteraceae bacterium]|nr:DUF4129 domain-containing protein [Anaeromyxobacteraceae bacterium]